MLIMKKIITSLLTIIICAALPVSGIPSAAGATEAQRSFDELVSDFMSQYRLNENNFSYAYYNTVTGETHMFNENRQMLAASIYKLPLNMYYYEQVALGNIDPNSRYAGYSLRDCHRLSLQYSDNDTAHAMRVAMGTYRDFKIAIDKYTGVSAVEIGWRYLTENYFSALTILNTLKYLYINSVFFSEAIGYLKAANPGAYFKSYVRDYEIAQKYGWLLPAVNTAGIIYTPTPYLLCVFTDGAGSAEMVVGRFNELVCNYTVATNRAYESKGIFYDLIATQWYFEYVESAVSLGLINGTEERKFLPAQGLKLSEAIKLAAVIHNKHNGGDGVFHQGWPWYQVYIDYALENGIIGTEDFDDFDKIATRAEMVYILSGCVPESALEDINTIDYLPDMAEESRFAHSVIKLFRAGVITGSDEQRNFYPDSTITRAEVSVVVMRIVNHGLRVRFDILLPE